MDALSWWMRGGEAPPLVSTGPLPGGTVLFPTNDLVNQARFGGRFTLGYWCNPCETEGFQGNFFILGRASSQYDASTTPTGPTIGRPFTDVPTPADGLTPNQFINLAPAGSQIANADIHVRATSNLMGAEANYRKAFWQCDDCSRVDFVAGYRFLRFDELLTVPTNQVFVPNQTVNSIGVYDLFRAQNQFHGGQFGLNWQRNHGRLGVDVLGKLAIGGLSQRVSIQGQTTVTPSTGAPITQNAGVLALRSNSGVFQRNVFSMIPELNANLTYQLTDLWHLRVGYTLFFVTNVARPGNFVDTNLNSQQFGGGNPSGNSIAPPTFAFRNDYIWVQGVNLGIECRF